MAIYYNEYISYDSYDYGGRLHGLKVRSGSTNYDVTKVSYNGTTTGCKPMYLYSKFAYNANNQLELQRGLEEPSVSSERVSLNQNNNKQGILCYCGDYVGYLKYRALILSTARYNMTTVGESYATGTYLYCFYSGEVYLRPSMCKDSNTIIFAAESTSQDVTVLNLTIPYVTESDTVTRILCGVSTNNTSGWTITANANNSITIVRTTYTSSTLYTLYIHYLVIRSGNNQTVSGGTNLANGLTDNPIFVEDYGCRLGSSTGDKHGIIYRNYSRAPVRLQKGTVTVYLPPCRILESGTIRPSYGLWDSLGSSSSFPSTNVYLKYGDSSSTDYQITSTQSGPTQDNYNQHEPQFSHVYIDYCSYEEGDEYDNRVYGIDLYADLDGVTDSEASVECYDAERGGVGVGTLTSDGTEGAGSFTARPIYREEMIHPTNPIILRVNVGDNDTGGDAGGYAVTGSEV